MAPRPKKVSVVTLPQEWRPIRSFPGYSVSDYGYVRNDDTGRIMRQTPNQRGFLNVGLVRAGLQYKRSVSVLVAFALLKTAGLQTFDTPINLDGDRQNNYASNLMWRPRWFAIKYFQQFEHDPPGFRRPIEEISTLEWFPTSWDAAIKYGLLDREIMTATIMSTYVNPTFQVFRLVG